MTTYTHRPWRIAAIKWTGDNLADVEQFARDYIGDLDDIGLHNDPWEETVNGHTYTNNAVQFYAWGDDQEVDPERWIVVPLDAGDEAHGEIMYSDEFEAAYAPEVSA